MGGLSRHIDWRFLNVTFGRANGINRKLADPSRQQFNGTGVHECNSRENISTENVSMRLHCNCDMGESIGLYCSSDMGE